MYLNQNPLSEEHNKQYSIICKGSLKIKKNGNSYLFLLLNVCPQYLHSWLKESGKWTLSMCFTRLFFCVHSFPQTVHCHPELTPDFVMYSWNTPVIVPTKLRY